MQRALYVSLALHIVVLLMAYLGLPRTKPEEALTADTAMSVDLVDVAELSNLPPTPGPKPEAEPKEKPRPLAQAPEPAHREQPPPAAKPAPEPPAKPRIEPEAPAEVVAPPAKTQPAVPTPVVEPVPALDFAPKKRAKAPPRPAPETAAAGEEAKKPEPEKAEAKAEVKPARPPAEQVKPKPDAELDFAAVLKSLEAGKQPGAPGPTSPGTAAAGEAATATSRSAGASYDPGLPVTVSEIDAVRRQIEQCWNLPAGARDAANLKVTIVVDMNADGTPRRAVIDEQRLAQADPQYRVAAESALRAVLNPRCHPFKLPREKYERWKTMTLVFDPKEMFGT